MKFATSACLLACLTFTTTTLADATPEAEAAELVSEAIDAQDAHLEARQGAIAVNPGLTSNPLQYPTVNTQWLESTILSTTTWIEVIYTQTFAPVPDQGPSPGVGSIGYGTLKKNGYLVPFVIEERRDLVTQYVQPVLEVLVLHTVTILQNLTSLGNETTYGTWLYNGTMTNNSTGVYNGTALFNSTGGDMGNYTDIPLLSNSTYTKYIDLNMAHSTKSSRPFF